MHNKNIEEWGHLEDFCHNVCKIRYKYAYKIKKQKFPKTIVECRDSGWAGHFYFPYSAYDIIHWDNSFWDQEKKWTIATSTLQFLNIGNDIIIS